MFESVIMLLIGLCLFAAVVYLVLWALGSIGINLPPRIIQIFWVIVVLIVALYLYKIVGPIISSGHLPGLH